MNKLVLWIMSIGTAFSVATLYLSQPLLEILRIQFNTSLSETGFIVTLTQIGYAFGILLLIPLGDVINKKWLIQIKLAAVAGFLVLAGFSPNISTFFFASFVIGILATAAQDFIPLAADLAPVAERGKIVGTVMSGLLIGILLSRTFSGIIAQHFGWRSVFFMSAIVIIFLLILISLLIPSHPPKVILKYSQLMHSMGRIFLENPLLQLSILTQGLIGVVMSAFWTVLTFHLSAAPFNLSTASIGFFGLAGAAGAAIAPLAGKLADKKGPLLNIKSGILLIAFSFILMLLFQRSIPVLIIATIVFDLGVQTAFISHQTIIYAMHPEARARINSLFMTGVFIFFSIGSFAGSLIFSYHGWTGVIYLSLICCVVSFVTHLFLSREYRQLTHQNSSSKLGS